LCCCFSWPHSAFVGQGKSSAPAGAAGDDGAAVALGMKQDEQVRVLDEFRAGTVQVLLATCIAEEGLDVPQVSWGI